MSEHNKITITFSTTSGDHTDDFPQNQPLHAVKKQVLAKLGLDVNTADSYEVSLDGQKLDESKTLSELGLTDGVVLILERGQIVKV